MPDEIDRLLKRWAQDQALTPAQANRLRKAVTRRRKGQGTMRRFAVLVGAAMIGFGLKTWLGVSVMYVSIGLAVIAIAFMPSDEERQTRVERWLEWQAHGKRRQDEDPDPAN